MIDYPQRYRLRLRPAWPWITVTAAFGLSRLLYYLAGMRFDARSLDFYWHFLDPQLLRQDLLRSLFYLHGQPPLFNLYLGVVLKAFPGQEVVAFYITFLAFGLLMALAVYILLDRLGVPAPIGVVLTILWCASPVQLLYEDWLFNSYPLAALLALSALFLHRFLDRGRPLDGVVLFTLLAGIALTGSFFHLLWFVFLTGALLIARRRDWRKVLAVSALPLLLVLALFLKNLFLFGTFTSSTWFGMNLARVSTWQLPEEERKRLVAEGTLSPLALIQPLSKLDAYQGLYTAVHTGIPVLDETTKSTGAPSLEHLAYVDISARYLRDALVVITHYPQAYARGLQRSFLVYFFPASDYFPRQDNRTRIQGLDRLYNILFCGQVIPAEATIMHLYETQQFLNVGLVLLVGYPLLFCFGLWRGLRALTRRPADGPQALTALFCCANIAYVTCVGNFFEIGENNRFRFVVTPLYIVLLGLFLAWGWGKVSRWVRRWR